MNRSIVLLLIAFAPMLFEARRSRRHERALRSRGAIEPEHDVYPLMQVAYPACFLAMVAEGWAREAPPASLTAAGAVIFAAGKVLKYWAIATLGSRWTFRVLVLPGAPLIMDGPYRWLRHPNYVGVAGELAGFALLAAAPITGVLSLVVFGTLMFVRMAVEERALDARDR
jgi:methyltransferase